MKKGLITVPARYAGTGVVSVSQSILPAVGLGQASAGRRPGSGPANGGRRGADARHRWARTSRSSTRQFSNPSAIRRSMCSAQGSSFDPRRGRGLGRMASGDFRTCPCDSRGTCVPCCGTPPTPGQSPGSNGPLLSSRRSLSLVPPLAMCLTHLRRVSADNAATFRWVNSVLLLSPIFNLLPTGVRTPIPPALARSVGRPASGVGAGRPVAAARP